MYNQQSKNFALPWDFGLQAQSPFSTSLMQPGFGSGLGSNLGTTPTQGQTADNKPSGYQPAAQISPELQALSNTNSKAFTGQALTASQVNTAIRKNTALGYPHVKWKIIQEAMGIKPNNKKSRVSQNLSSALVKRIYELQMKYSAANPGVHFKHPGVMDDQTFELIRGLNQINFYENEAKGGVLSNSAHLGVAPVENDAKYDYYKTVIEQVGGGQFDSTPGFMNIVGIRGWHDGIKTENEQNIYNDALMVLYLDPNGQKHVQEFRGTVDPGYVRKNMAHISDGQHTFVRGLHKGYNAFREKNEKTSIWRDKNGNGVQDADEVDHVESGTGVNMHAGSAFNDSVNKFSEGCINIAGGGGSDYKHGKEWLKFRKLLYNAKTKNKAGKTVSQTEYLVTIVDGNKIY